MGQKKIRLINRLSTKRMFSLGGRQRRNEDVTIKVARFKGQRVSLCWSIDSHVEAVLRWPGSAG